MFVMLFTWHKDVLLPDQMYHSIKTFQIGVAIVLLLAGTYVAYVYLKKSMNHNFNWYLQNFTSIPSIVQEMNHPTPDKKPSFAKVWKNYKKRQYEQAIWQSHEMGQIREQLYAPLFSKDDHGHSEAVSTYVELMGNLMTVFRQDKPSMSMYIHPQDTILDIMQKFKLRNCDVLVVDGQRLDDLNKCLLQYGIPDNWKVDAMVEPRTVSFNQELKEIFNLI